MKQLGLMVILFEISVLIHNYKYHRALSELPISKAVAGVRVGMVGNKFIINPTTKEMEDSELDLLVAGTASAILMIEVNSSSFVYQLLIYLSICGCMYKHVPACSHSFCHTKNIIVAWLNT